MSRNQARSSWVGAAKVKSWRFFIAFQPFNWYNFSMDILEYCQALDLELKVYHSPGAVNKWIAVLQKPFYSVAFKDKLDDCTLTSLSGQAETPVMAIKLLCATLRDRFIVIDPGAGTNSKERQKFKVPNLEYNQ